MQASWVFLVGEDSIAQDCRRGQLRFVHAGARYLRGYTHMKLGLWIVDALRFLEIILHPCTAAVHCSRVNLCHIALKMTCDDPPSCHPQLPR